MKHIMHVGLDVDDNAFHGCGIFEKEGQEQILEFKTKPNVGALMQRLGNFRKDGFELRVCYEATYLGFSLARDLEKHKIACELIAPSSIPKQAQKTAKTDRIDSRDLAKYYKNGLLTVVQIPTESMEKARDLIRSRQFIRQQRQDLKRHVLAICRRSGLNYRASCPAQKAHYFTEKHHVWMESQIKNHTDASFKFNIEMLLSQLRQFENQISNYDTEIGKIAQAPEYQKKVQALICYRGIDILSAMGLILELGDITRFSHPRKLTSYAGMDLREYSSGGKERKYSMSKMGNSHIRTTVVEACQGAKLKPKISRSLKNRRDGIPAKYTEVADRCMKRLYKKSTHLLLVGKPVNKVKVACAREMLGFVWESLNLAV